MLIDFIPGALTYEQIVRYYAMPTEIVLSESIQKNVERGRAVVESQINDKKVVYGVNTGFGKFSNTVISDEKLYDLQYNLLVSHAVGIGTLLSDNLVQLIYFLKINTLAQGHSGVRWKVIAHLMAMQRAGIIPCVPSKGSVGASGDLAPLAHFALPMIGEGQVRSGDRMVTGKEALAAVGLSPIVLQPKEGLSMINGLQVSTALALEGIILTERLLKAAIEASALTIVGAAGRYDAFDERILACYRSESAQYVAEQLRARMCATSKALRVQDPYTLRCIPQVLGACYEQWEHAKRIMVEASNSVSDNPVVFAKESEIISGGNFHGQRISMASDNIALLLATMGNFSERRIALLMDPHFSGLPAFLVAQGGENSGLMMLQVTAAALASENKMYAHPASVDTIPTSNNQEDHVSMATFSGRRLCDMIDNVASIVAIECIAAVQAIDFRKPTNMPPALQKSYETIRNVVSFYDRDRSLSESIDAVKSIILSGLLEFPEEQKV